MHSQNMMQVMYARISPSGAMTDSCGAGSTCVRACFANKKPLLKRRQPQHVAMASHDPMFNRTTWALGSVVHRNWPIEKTTAETDAGPWCPGSRAEGHRCCCWGVSTTDVYSRTKQISNESNNEYTTCTKALKHHQHTRVQRRGMGGRRPRQEPGMSPQS